MSVNYYSIDDLFKLRTSIEIKHLRAFKEEKKVDPDLLIIEDNNLKFSKKGRRLEYYYYFYDDSGLYIDYWLPINVKLAIKNFEGNMEVRYTKAYKKYTDFNTLIQQVLSAKLTLKGLTLIQAAGIAQNDEAFLISGMGGTGKTSTLLSIIDNSKFLSGDHIIIDRNGMTYSYISGERVSPNTMAGNIYLSNKEKMELKIKEFISKSNNLVQFLGKLGIGMSTRLDLLEKLNIGDKAKINTFFILNRAEKREIREIDRDEALKKILTATFELKPSHITHNALLLYFYLFPSIGIMDIMRKREEIIRESLKNVKCFELRGAKLEDFPEMIRNYLKT